MPASRGWTLVLLLGCGSTHSQLDAPSAASSLESTAHAPASAAAGPGCVTPEGTPLPGEHDLDGDGVPELITERYDELIFYRRRGECTTAFATLKPGPIAFVHVSPGFVQVETWLMHGDRRSVGYRYEAGHFVQNGPAREIVGPRWPRRK